MILLFPFLLLVCLVANEFTTESSIETVVYNVTESSDENNHTQTQGEEGKCAPCVCHCHCH